jgi:hypothetical protein
MGTIKKTINILVNYVILDVRNVLVRPIDNVCSVKIIRIMVMFIICKLVRRIVLCWNVPQVNIKYRNGIDVENATRIA